MLVDMHVHTNYSPCSIINISQLLDACRSIGIDGVCVTDHDTLSSKYDINNLKFDFDLFVVVGMEYTTKQGDFLIFGDIENIPRGMNALELLNFINKIDGIAIPAHPFRRSRPVDVNILSNFDIVEILNGRNTNSENDICKEWISKNGKKFKGIGGSDAHTINEVGNIVTRFDKNIYSLEDLIRELKDNRYSAYQLCSIKSFT
jgi:hypothetical protein